MIGSKPIREVCESDWTTRVESTARTSWMANNAIPDSIIMNTMICRSLVPLVEPKVCPTEVMVALTSKNTLMILNTIKLVTRVFTAMDKAKYVCGTISSVLDIGISSANQVARGNKLKSAYQIMRKID